MAHSVIIHLTGEHSVIGEIEELPKPMDSIITVSNPRLKDGKDIQYLESEVVQVIWPMHRVNLIEVLEGTDEERIIGFVRD